MSLPRASALRNSRLSKAVRRILGYPLRSEERKMLSMFEAELKKIDAGMDAIQPRDIPHLFRNFPLELFGRLLLDVPAQYPRIKAFFPSMPSREVQETWTGSHGQVLLNQSLAFIKTMLLGYVTLTGNKIENANLLDYGCGWGRLIRLLYKYVSIENIYGVDPWNESIRVCEQHGVKGNLLISEYVPLSLPFELKFDLIFAFSVFTHLSEKTAHTVLNTLRKYISPDGLLVITIRPKEFWGFHKNGFFESEMLERHEKNGFAFIPHQNMAPINGEITYGISSMTLDYIANNFPQWKVESVECNEIDLYQLILFLRPR